MQNEILKEIKNEDEQVKEIDFSKVKSPKSKCKSKGVTSAGVMSIIKSKCGNRLSISPPVFKRLDNQKKIQLGFCEKHILIGTNLPEIYEKNVVKQEGKKSIKGLIYNTGLINEIVDHFNLDFQGRTSMTFQEVRYESYKGKEVAYITILD